MDGNPTNTVCDEKFRRGTGKMAEEVKDSLCKHQVLSLNTQNANKIV